MDKSPGKTALFFGSFDPVHIGHLIIAEYFFNQSDVKDVWFVISPQNPFKADKQITDQEIRKQMLKLAIGSLKGFEVCDIEYDMPAPHYTYKTLTRLKEVYPQREFLLLIGADNLQEFDKWKNYREILEMIPVFVYPRPGYNSDEFNHFPRLHKSEAPLMEISSSLIRKNLADGLSARFLVPPKVYEFIMKNNIYQRPNAAFNLST